jgi:hypothetical protein
MVIFCFFSLLPKALYLKKNVYVWLLSAESVKIVFIYRYNFLCPIYFEKTIDISNKSMQYC